MKMTTASQTFIELHRQAVAGVQGNLAQALDFYNASSDASEKAAWAEAIILCCDTLDRLADDLHV